MSFEVTDELPGAVSAAARVPERRRVCCANFHRNIGGDINNRNDKGEMHSNI